MWKYEKGEKIRIFQDTDPKIHNIYDTPNDCEGSVLFDYMSDHGIINDWDESDAGADTDIVDGNILAVAEAIVAAKLAS